MEKIKSLAVADILKIVGGLAVFIPLMSGILQYRQSVQQTQDQNFRTVVESLSSESKEDRLAAAASLGTFVKKGGDYYEEAVDILINRLSIELDYNVLNAIRGSMEKIDKDDYRRIISRLLAINRSILTQSFVLNNWKENDYNAYIKSANKLFEMKNRGFYYYDSVEVNNLRDEVNRKWERSFKTETEYSEISKHKQVISDFIAVLFRIAEPSQLSGLTLYQISLNSTQLNEIDMTSVILKHSAISSSVVQESKFDNSTIIGTVFSNSDFSSSSFTNCKFVSSLLDLNADFRNADFSGSEFKDVFFAGSNLSKAKFTGAKGLKPEYFYKALKLDDAVFDPEFKKELDDKLPRINDAQYLQFVENSTLTDQRRDELLSPLEIERTKKK